MDAGHEGVYLGYDKFCVLTCGLDNINADPEAHKPVTVRRGHLDQGHIDIDYTLGKEVRHLGKKQRGVVSKALVDRLPGIVAYKE